MTWFAKRQFGKAMWFLVGVMALTLTEGHAAGQCVEQKLLASDGTVRDLFGLSVSISGTPGNEVVIVGTPGDADNGIVSGSAYIYRFNPDTAGWVEEAKLLASDGTTGDRFGWSVSITGAHGNEVAIVGAYQASDNSFVSGSIYIYRFNGVTWDEEQKLIASDAAEGDQFGKSVSISGAHGNEVAIVGTARDNYNGSRSGSAYIYRKRGRNWVEESKLLPSDGSASTGFGTPVSISSAPGKEVAIVGTHGNGFNLNVPGSAYIYRKSGATWVEEAKLLASDGELSDFFGYSVSISSVHGNEVAIVGANGDDDLGSASGSAYIYRFNGVNWVEEQKLFASDGAANDRFGFSVSINGADGNEVAIVGAHAAHFFITSGSAYIYRRSDVSWVEEAKILASGSELDDFYGYSVSISGAPGNEVAIVGAYRDNDNGLFSGSAYIFDLPCDSAPCRSDINGDDFVNVADLLLLLGVWAPCPAPCSADTNGDGYVNITDLLDLLAAWGPCP